MVEVVETVLSRIEDFFPDVCRVCAAPYVGAVLLYGIWIIEPGLLYIVFALHQWGDGSYADW